MLKFFFTNLHVDPDNTPHCELGTLVGQVANIFGDIRIAADGTEVYADESFPIVEFAGQLSKWLESGIDEAVDFSFESMFFEDPGEFCIVSHGNSWRVLSKVHPLPTGDYPSEDMRASVRIFLEELREGCKRSFGIEAVAF